MQESCLFAKLGAYVNLSGEDRRLLGKLEKDERAYRRDSLVRLAGQTVHEMYVVKEGWLASFTILEDGRRQVMRLFYPGDIVDLSQVALEKASYDVKCLTGAVLCPFPKSGLDDIFIASPRLTALLFSVTVKEGSALMDRIRAIGRLSAYERLCYMLLEISDRLRITVPTVDEGFRAPLTQSDIADLLGLTNVYVSKTMARIEKDGLISRQGNRIKLLDEARMRRICEYKQVPQIDTSWFPREQRAEAAA